MYRINTPFFFLFSQLSSRRLRKKKAFTRYLPKKPKPRIFFQVNLVVDVPRKFNFYHFSSKTLNTFPAYYSLISTSPTFTGGRMTSPTRPAHFPS